MTASPRKAGSPPDSPAPIPVFGFALVLFLLWAGAAGGSLWFWLERGREYAAAGADFSLRGLIFVHVFLWAAGLLLAAVGVHRIRKSAPDARAPGPDEAPAEGAAGGVGAPGPGPRLGPRQWRIFADHIPAGIFLKDGERKFTLVNLRCMDILGDTEENLLGADGYKYLPETLALRVEALERRVLATGQAADIVYTFDSDQSGDGRIFDLTLFPLHGDGGELKGLGGLLADTTQRHRTERELIMARDTAELASQAKTNFLANISHEIRTPLNGVIGMADLLMRTKLNADQLAMAATIKTGGDALLGVLNDVLDISKIEAGKLVIESAPFSLRDLIYDAVQGLAPIAYPKKVEVIVDIAPQVPDGYSGDYVRIRQIILNLVSNAIKFTDHGEVYIAARLRGQTPDSARLRISVADTGIGIPAHKRGLIFDTFEQADSSITRRYGGSGLGLAISNRLAALMGSRLKLRSRVGRGSVFWFDLALPLAREFSERSETGADFESLRGVKLLCVIENAVHRRLAGRRTRDWGLDGHVVDSVDAALARLQAEAASEHPFEVVLSDYHFPGKNGLDLWRAMRQDPGLAALPMIMMACGDPLRPTDPGDRFFNCLKPIRGADLMRTMTAALKGDAGSPGFSGAAQRGEAEKNRPAASLSVLLVEDMEMNRMVAKGLLSELGCRTTMAVNGAQAVELARRRSFDLIFMDIQMPVMDGMTAVELIRTRERESGQTHIPIVGMTAHALKGDREKYLAGGLDGYLTKPITLTAVSRVIREMVDRFQIKADRPAAVPGSENAAAGPAPMSAGRDSAIDFKIVSSALGGNLGLVRQSLEIYRRDAPNLMAGIIAAVENQDAAALGAGAHALKGITSHYTRTGAFETAAFLARKAPTVDWGRDQNETAELARRLEVELDLLLAAMAEYLAAENGTGPEVCP